jgi:ribosome biogenesis GTPase A
LIDANVGKMQAVILKILGKKYIDQYESEMDDMAEEIRRELNSQVFQKIEWDDDGKKQIEVAEIVFTKKIIQ